MQPGNFSAWIPQGKPFVNVISSSNSLLNKPALAFSLASFSGFLLFTAFPPVGASSLAFVALIPFLWALRLYPEAKLRLGYLAGLCFWIPSLWFLSPVTIPGAVLLAAYCAVYWVPLAWGWGMALSTWSPHRVLQSLFVLLGGAALWCTLEWVRSWVLTGFPWNELGVSQWENLGLIQIATLGGVRLISFIILSINLGIGLSLIGLFEQLGTRQRNRMHPELYLPILLLAVSFTWGMGQLRARLPERIKHQKIRMAAIQPLSANKWSEELAAENFRVLWELSDAAASLKPDLVIWPETALPEELRYSKTSASLVGKLVSTGVPLLVGSLDFETSSEGEEITRSYYNSSFLINPEGGIESEYRKQHLVMFGEYMPFARWLPFLRSLTPMPEDVSPGTGYGSMELPESGLHMGMVICFEDLMPGLTRSRVEEGADVFINQTNDAWFDPLWGSRAHLAHSVFRSIEQRRPTVRVTNSGVSAWIDIRGVIRDRIEDPLTGEFRIRGFKTFEVEIPSHQETTFYFRVPWLFPVVTLIVSITFLGWGFRRRKM
jgi:apolipoprotein N-acyltransferase